MKDYGLSEIDVLTKNNSLVLFYADWCQYCSQFKPVFEEKVKFIDPKFL
ncbi:MAG: protein disulfide isomerase family protein, partial [Candidatus Nitrosocosmicus sp.]